MLVLAGLWLAPSPLVVGYTRLQYASWHNALAGVAVMALAVRLRSSPARRPAPAAPLVGLAAVAVHAFLARRRPAEPGRT